MRTITQGDLESARKNILAYACLMNPNYQIPKHLVKIAKVLHAVEAGKLKRVILTIPPRHGKSLLCSSNFPAWYLGRNPDKYIITATFGQKLSDGFGRQVRNQVKDPIFRSIFPNCQMAGDSTAANRFDTTKSGSYYAVGVGGAITGRGAHLFVIDDPIKGREEADSETQRRKLKEWYTSVAYTRLMPGGSIFVISTRWHEDDLVGYLLKEQSHEKWTLVNLKAIDDNGNALWPEAYPLEVLENIRKNNRYDFASLYQQEPVNKDTQVFDYSKITGYETLPEIKMVLTACDPAISKEKKACNTAFCTLGVGVDNHVYDLETVAGQWGFFETLEEAKAILSRQKSQYLGVESNQYQRALVEACERYFPQVQVFSLNAHKDKFLRAKSVSHIIEQGLFHTNNRELLNEIRNFDPEVVGETRKDRVDALVHGLHMVQQYALPKYEKKEEPFKGLSGAQVWQKQQQIILKRQIDAELAQVAGLSPVEVFQESDVQIDPNYY